MPFVLSAANWASCDKTASPEKILAVGAGPWLFSFSSSFETRPLRVSLSFAASYEKAVFHMSNFGVFPDSTSEDWTLSDWCAGSAFSSLSFQYNVA
jgi:hypothetical protein